MPLKIIPYQSVFAKDFKDLNIEWLEKYFYVEPYDLKVLSNPEEHIINKGGHIFFATENNLVFGTVALMLTDTPNVFELTKMAVHPTRRGEGIGKTLMEYCLTFARSSKCPSILLYSHRKLENAIHIYRKYGFKEIPVEESSLYERADIKMELVLK